MGLIFFTSLMEAKFHIVIQPKVSAKYLTVCSSLLKYHQIDCCSCLHTDLRLVDSFRPGSWTLSFVLEQSLLVRLGHRETTPIILVSKALCVQPAKGGKLLE
jgi:hypothetical protein